MKYRVTARDWDYIDLGEQSLLRIRFGDRNSIHDLSDSEVVDAIKKFGRAEITPDDDFRSSFKLEFQNDYD